MPLSLCLRETHLAHVQAAAIPLTGPTAWQALVDTAGIGEGGRVLINGAAGGVGHLAVQVAKARGAYLIAPASAANAAFVRSLGADEVIDYAATDFTDVVSDRDVVLEVIGGDYPAWALDVLKPGGILVRSSPPPYRRSRGTRQSAGSGLPAASSKPTGSR